MRRCSIYRCAWAGEWRCCSDCDKEDCEARCLNHPDRCKCLDTEPRRKPGQKISTVNPERIIQLTQQGLTQKEIAALEHCSISTVSYYLRRSDLPPRKRGERRG